MVKKLLKYELRAMKKWMIPVAIALIAFAIIGRIGWLIRIDKTDSLVVYSIIRSMQFSGTAVFVITEIALITIAIIMYIVRFYKHLMTKEGYLSFCLPVSVADHLIAKLLSAVICEVCVGIIALLSLMIFGIGTEVMADAFRAFGIIFGGLFDAFGVVNLCFFVLEGILLVACMLVFYPMVFYTCISIGQLMSKHRILGAILCYAGWTTIVQFISGFLAFSIQLPMSLWLLPLLDDLTTLGIVLHVFAWIGILVLGGLTFAFFRISRKVLTNKLNLE